MFDTHAHLNFSRFKKNYDEVIRASQQVGVKYMVIPGTDLETSKKAVEIAEQYEEIYVAVGIHPHHVFELNDSNIYPELEALLKHLKVVAVGEVGLDRHSYENTKYEDYHVDDRFIELQKQLLIKQLQLAVEHKKSVILHNREAKSDMLPLLSEYWDESFRGRMVFHCCEPDVELLKFAQEHGMYIGVDGDVTYYPEKQAWIKTVPLDMLVLETDSPFLLPEPMRGQKLYPNTPTNIPFIAEYVAELRGEPAEMLKKTTTENAMNLFGLLDSNLNL